MISSTVNSYSNYWAKNNAQPKLLLGLIILLGAFELKDTLGFSIAPMGLSGAYLPFGNYAKAGKSGYGVSWSKNLDGEIKLRKELCSWIPDNVIYQYRYHNDSQACYKLGDTGPCGQNMVFFGFQTNAVYGQCDCNYNDNGRAMIYDPQEKMCHFVFSKGSCKVNEWLTFDLGWKPVCQPNKCIASYDQLNKIIPTGGQELHGVKGQKAVWVEYVPYQGSCVALGESCEDKKDPQWASMQHLPYEVQFVKGKLNARCAPRKLISWRFPTPKMQCVPGGYLSSVMSLGVANNSTSGAPQQGRIGKDKCQVSYEV